MESNRTNAFEVASLPMVKWQEHAELPPASPDDEYQTDLAYEMTSILVRMARARGYFNARSVGFDHASAERRRQRPLMPAGEPTLRFDALKRSAKQTTPKSDKRPTSAKLINDLNGLIDLEANLRSQIGYEVDRVEEAEAAVKMAQPGHIRAARKRLSLAEDSLIAVSRQHDEVEAAIEKTYKLIGS